MSAVTDRVKCYVSVCVGCDLLFQADRKDQLTCSPACRVRAHRNGSLKTLRTLALAWDIEPAGIQHAQAIRRLCPALERDIVSRAKTIAQCQPEVTRAFVATLMSRKEAGQ